MLFSVAAGLFLMASSVVAAPSNLEKKGKYVVYETVYHTVNAQPQNVVYKTVTVGGRPHHHHPHKPKPTSTCSKSATQPANNGYGYSVITKTYVYGQPTQAPSQPSQYQPSQQPAQPSQPPTYGGGYGGGNLDANMQGVLDLHNSLRAQYGCGPLEWSDELAQAARDRAYVCEFKHKSHNQYGENLAVGYGSGAKSVQAWFDERSQYDYGNPQFGENTGHFTQVIWKASTKIGCHWTTQEEDGCTKNNGMLRCEYEGPGNYAGEFSANVPHPLGGNYGY